MSEVPTFADLGVDPKLVQELEKDGIEAPFPIQALTIPDALAGRDICGQAETGSGKTLAFGLPMLQRILEAEPRRPHGLVVVPTRELANQVASILQPLGQAIGKGVLAVYGGTSVRDQTTAMRRGIEIVVATPARLIDLLERQTIFLDRLAVLVIDEADEMADLGFLPQVQSIMRAVSGDHQTMLFSATLDHRVQVLIRNYMTDPVFHRAQSGSRTVESSEHRFIEVQATDKARLTARVAAAAGRTLVFVRTKRNCDRVATDLRSLGVAAKAIHGDLDQAQRERALGQFRCGQAARSWWRRMLRPGDSTSKESMSSSTTTSRGLDNLCPSLWAHCPRRRSWPGRNAGLQRTTRDRRMDHA